MKPIYWTDHALNNVVDREIDQAEAEKTIRHPEYVVADPPERQIPMRRYYDRMLEKEMLLRVVIEETPLAITVITVFKTSQIRRYLKGLTDESSL